MPQILASILGLMATAAVAQDSATIADVRCVVVGMQIAGAATSPQQSRGVFMTLYYIGRLDGRTPKLDIERLIVAEANRMTSTDYASEGQRCEAGLTEKGQQITQIGRDMTGVGKAAPSQGAKDH
jgi:hypothetical protein